jgi:hypothetical protein
MARAERRGELMEDYMTADDWAALVRLGERAKRGLAASTVSAAQSAKFQRRGYVADEGHGIVVTAAGRTAIANWERSRRT